MSALLSLVGTNSTQKWFKLEVYGQDILCTPRCVAAGIRPQTMDASTQLLQACTAAMISFRGFNSAFDIVCRTLILCLLYESSTALLKVITKKYLFIKIGSRPIISY